MLVSPNDDLGVMLMSDVGGNTALTLANQVTLTFDDNATAPLSADPLASGLFKPTNLSGAPDTFPAPVPALNFASALSAFAGINPNGNWKLYIRDNNPGPGTTPGALAGGFSIDIITRP